MSMRHSDSSLPRQKKILFDDIDSRTVKFESNWNERKEEKNEESQDIFQLPLYDGEDPDGDKKH